MAQGGHSLSATVLVRSTNGGKPKINVGKGRPWGDHTLRARQLAHGGRDPPGGGRLLLTLSGVEKRRMMESESTPTSPWGKDDPTQVKENRVEGRLGGGLGQPEEDRWRKSLPQRAGSDGSDPPVLAHANKI